MDPARIRMQWTLQDRVCILHAFSRFFFFFCSVPFHLDGFFVDAVKSSLVLVLSIRISLLLCLSLFYCSLSLDFVHSRPGCHCLVSQSVTTDLIVYFSRLEQSTCLLSCYLKLFSSFLQQYTCPPSRITYIASD